MFELPPQQIEYVYYATAAQSDLSSLQSAQTSDPIDGIVAQICQEFSDGLSWSDIPQLAHEVFQLVKSVSGSADQEAAMIEVVNKVIDETDTPLLPDRISDPIFKQIAGALIHFLMHHNATQITKTSLPGASGEISASDTAPSADQAMAFAQELSMTFKGGFHASDVVTLVIETNSMISSLSGLTDEQRKAFLVSIIDDFIDMTDFPYLPDSIIDPLFKAVVPSIVNFIF